MALFGAAPAAPREPNGEAATLSVAQFTAILKDALESLGTHRVAGEVSNFTE